MALDLVENEQLAWSQDVAMATRAYVLFIRA